MSRERSRAIIREHKNRPCVDCERRYPYYVMHFDHVRGDKRFIVSKAISRGIAVETLLEEIAKCEVVCANCHAMRHAGQFRKSVTANAS